MKKDKAIKAYQDFINQLIWCENGWELNKAK
jgi:hypothetical protein